jgi:hypothetical protein
MEYALYKKTLSSSNIVYDQVQRQIPSPELLKFYDLCSIYEIVTVGNLSAYSTYFGSADTAAWLLLITEGQVCVSA